MRTKVIGRDLVLVLGAAGVAYAFYQRTDAYRHGNRLFYGGGRPNRLGRAAGDLWAAVARRGLGPAYIVSLETVGHRTGRRTAIPLVLADHGGRTDPAAGADGIRRQITAAVPELLARAGLERRREPVMAEVALLDVGVRVLVLDDLGERPYARARTLRQVGGQVVVQFAQQHRQLVGLLDRRRLGTEGLGP
jgi:hypothetical protein